MSLAGSPACYWRSNRDLGVSVAVVVGGDLFVDTYRNRFLPIFRPVEIDGLPAVHIASDQGYLSCTTTVGVADGESLDVNTTLGSERRPGDDPCEEGRRVAEAIVATLPPK